MEDYIVEIIDDKDLSGEYMNLMNKSRVIEFGEDEVKDFKKDYFPSSKFFFVKVKKEIMAFGALRDISIDYLGKKYEILGICNIISIVKKKGYGKILILAIIDYLKKTGKTGLGFTLKTEFFKKAGLKTEKDFIKRFVYIDPLTKKEVIDNEGDGIYFNGKDDFIKEVLSTDSIVYINIHHW
jgi:hypothetical protein